MVVASTLDQKNTLLKQFILLIVMSVREREMNNMKWNEKERERERGARELEVQRKSAVTKCANNKLHTIGHGEYIYQMLRKHLGDFDELHLASL